MTARNKFFLVVAIFYTLYTIFPLFSDLVPIPVWLPSILTSIVVVSLYPKVFNNKPFYWFLMYAFALVLFVIFGRSLPVGIGTMADSKKLLIELSYILPSICLFSVFYQLKDYNLVKKYVKVSVVLLYVSFVIAVPLMMRYTSLRAALSEQENYTAVVPGLPSYALMHAYVLFLPMACYALYQVQGKYKPLCLIALLSLCFVIYSTFVTTSLLVMIGILLFTVTYKDRSSTNMGIYLFFMALLFYVFYESGLLVAFIDLISPFFEGTFVQAKLEDIRASLVGEQMTGSSIISRQSLHDQSWASFASNPIFGSNDVGDHSSILDRFGGMGIIGGLPFVMIFVSFYSCFKKVLATKCAKSFFTVGMLAALVFLYEKGMWGGESWLMLLIMMPLSIWWLEQYNINTRYSRK